MNSKPRFAVVALCTLMVLSFLGVPTAFGDPPYVPNWFNIDDDVTLGNSYITLCASSQGDPDNDDYQIRIEIFSAPIADIQSDWMWAAPGNPVCYFSPYGFPDGEYSWQARAKDANGQESGASEVRSFTINASQYEEVDYSFQVDRGYQVTLDVDDCTILNAEELVAAEIDRKSDILGGLGSVDKVVEFVTYFFTQGIGEVENLRQEVESQVSGCSTVYYRIGDPTTGWTAMDSSGLGNIAYAYLLTTHNIPALLQNFIADVDQTMNSVYGILTFLTEYMACSGQVLCFMSIFTIIQGDNPDDIKQREVGAALTGNLNEENLINTANSHGLY